MKLNEHPLFKGKSEYEIMSAIGDLPTIKLKDALENPELVIRKGYNISWKFR